MNGHLDVVQWATQPEAICPGIESQAELAPRITCETHPEQSITFQYYVAGNYAWNSLGQHVYCLFIPKLTGETFATKFEV